MDDMEDYSIYGGVFDVANQNMTASKHFFQFRREEIMLYAVGDPHNVDLLNLMDLDNSQFLFMAYVLLLQRFPESLAYHRWEKAGKLPKTIFQKQVLRTILRSHEFSLNSIKVYNNYTNSCKDDMTISGQESSYKNLDNYQKMWIYKFYQRLPVKFRLLIKKIMGYDMI